MLPVHQILTLLADCWVGGACYQHKAVYNDLGDPSSVFEIVECDPTIKNVFFFERLDCSMTTQISDVCSVYAAQSRDM